MRIRLILVLSALSIQASAMSAFEEELLLTPGKIEATEELAKSNKDTLSNQEQMIARQIERAEIQNLREKISNRITNLSQAQDSYAEVEDSGGMISKIGQYIEIISEKLDAAMNDVSALRELDLESERLVTDSL